MLFALMIINYRLIWIANAVEINSKQTFYQPSLFTPKTFIIETTPHPNSKKNKQHVNKGITSHPFKDVDALLAINIALLKRLLLVDQRRSNARQPITISPSPGNSTTGQPTRPTSKSTTSTTTTSTTTSTTTTTTTTSTTTPSTTSGQFI